MCALTNGISDLEMRVSGYYIPSLVEGIVIMQSGSLLWVTRHSYITMGVYSCMKQYSLSFLHVNM